MKDCARFILRVHDALYYFSAEMTGVPLEDLCIAPRSYPSCTPVTSLPRARIRQAVECIREISRIEVVYG
jgi:hypothetical protein